MFDFLNKENCVGCGACVLVCPNDCISMVADCDGFLYPTISNDGCINCNKCKKACPLLVKKENNEEINAFAVINKNDSVRFESTSGGMFSLIADWILKKGGVVCGASYDNDFSVRHILIEKYADLEKIRCAKYSQSILGTCFFDVKNFLDKGRYVLFSGTPCQVAGLKSYLNRDYEKLITVDLVCHGVPSPKAWKSYIEYRMKKDNQNNPPIYISQRSKITGWATYSVNLRYEDGCEYTEKNSQDPYIKAFIENLILRRSCFNCNFKGYERVSDFTLGDFWGIWNVIPKMNDNKGVSAVLLHSSKAKIIFQDIKDDIICEKVLPEDVSKENKCLIESSDINEERETFLKTLDWEGYEEKIKKNRGRNKSNIIKKAKNKLKRFL